MRYDDKDVDKLNLLRDDMIEQENQMLRAEINDLIEQVLKLKGELKVARRTIRNRLIESPQAAARRPITRRAGRTNSGRPDYAGRRQAAESQWEKEVESAMRRTGMDRQSAIRSIFESRRGQAAR